VAERKVAVFGAIMDVGGVGGCVVGACTTEEDVELTLPRIDPPPPPPRICDPGC